MNHDFARTEDSETLAESNCPKAYVDACRGLMDARFDIRLGAAWFDEIEATFA